MNTTALWKRFLIGSLFLALITGCTPATPTPEPTATIKPTITPLPFIEGTEFPTGIFEQVGGHWFVEFREDGTGFWHSTRKAGDANIIYGVNGNLYSEMQLSYPTGRQVPATYFWTYDGNLLTFQLWGKDLRPERYGYFHGGIYNFISEVEPATTEKKVKFPFTEWVTLSTRTAKSTAFVDNFSPALK